MSDDAPSLDELVTVHWPRPGCVRITLHRPPSNVFDQAMVSALARRLDELERSGAHVAVLASSSETFSAGADLTSMYDTWEGFTARLLDVQRRLQEVVDRWEALPFPTIALLPGHALGGGCELALGCDWRVMARGRGRIGFPEVRRGLLAGSGGTQRAIRLLGLPRARDLCLRGRMLDADEAERIGLVSTACDPDDLEAEGDRLVDELLALPAPALAATKRALTEGAGASLDTGLAIERREMRRVLATADAEEGVVSFVERREPRWTHLAPTTDEHGSPKDDHEEPR